MNKILIIGQAPPADKQTVPYDTTMLYDWLNACGITKEAAQTIFEFEAVSNTFPGYDKKGGHLKPSTEDCQNHWDKVLEAKVQMADGVILLGRVAADFFKAQPRTWSCNTEELELLHPSFRNYGLYLKNKDAIISKLYIFLNHNGAIK